MTTSTANLEKEREQLLKLAQEYRQKGYEVFFHPNPEDLPEFLNNYRPDMIVRRGEENVVIEVKSRSSLTFPSNQYLRNLAEAVEKHPGWRFELVITNSEDTFYLQKAERSLEEYEIKSQLQVARQLITQHPELAILSSWSLVEATLRLIAQKEEVNLQKFHPPYLVKQLAAEGVISKSEYQLLMDILPLRNAIVHGFKTTELNQNTVHELIDLTEQLLRTLHTGDEAS
ncbi:MAG: hypothetical protein RM021_021830 [Nostoc sp. EkiNYC01]|nr:hypothetical protein [Nostoc sp. EkiNYC01]